MLVYSHCYLWKAYSHCQLQDKPSVSSGEATTPAGTMFMWKTCTHMKCEVKHHGDMGMGIPGAFMTIVGHLWLKWVGRLEQSCFCSRKCWSSGEYPFQSRMPMFWTFWTPGASYIHVRPTAMLACPHCYLWKAYSHQLPDIVRPPTVLHAGTTIWMQSFVSHCWQS